MPPNGLIECTSNGFENSLRNVDMSPLLENFLVDHFCDLRHAVLLGAVEFKSLANSRVIVQHLFQTSANVD